MGGQWRKENPNPRVHRSGGKLGEPRFPLERVDPRVGIFLSPLTTHDGFYLSFIEVHVAMAAQYECCKNEHPFFKATEYCQQVLRRKVMECHI